MSKAMQMIIAHCEVCPWTREEGDRCRYPPNLTRYNLERHTSRKIPKKDLPIPDWCKLPDEKVRK